MPGFEVQSTFQLPTASALQRAADVKRQMYAANARAQQAQQPQRQTQDHHGGGGATPQAHPTSQPTQDHRVGAARLEPGMPNRVYPAQQGYDEATLLQAAALAQVQMQQQAALQQAQLAPSYAVQQHYLPASRVQVCASCGPHHTAAS